MRNVKWIIVGTVAIAIAGAGLLLDDASAQKKGKSRPATTEQLMEGLVLPHFKALGGALKKEDLNWKDIGLRAAMLAEGGHILMADGRCPDAEWAKGAKSMQSRGKELLAAVDKKDLAGAQAAFKSLTSEGCKVCHAKHKKK